MVTQRKLMWPLLLLSFMACLTPVLQLEDAYADIMVLVVSLNTALLEAVLPSVVCPQ
ncbi:hypothetical protein BDR03DRAFT_975147 [Suillus americanus]|nr:hypothetical protein BDR03DRAFT_975147 [Suillus americanus]